MKRLPLYLLTLTAGAVVAVAININAYRMPEPLPAPDVGHVHRADRVSTNKHAGMDERLIARYGLKH